MENITSTSLTPSQKIRFGNSALMDYHNQMVANDSNYRYTFDSLTNFVTSRENDFIESLGDAVGTSQKKLTQRRLSEAMERVVEKSSPENIPRVFDFIDGIVKELSSFDFSLFGDTAIDIAKDAVIANKKIVKTATDLSKGVGDTFSFFGNNMKLIVIGILGVVGFIGYKMTMNKVSK